MHGSGLNRKVSLKESFVMSIEGEKSMGKEKSVMRWGGLAGMLGSVAFIFTIVILLGFVPATPTTTEGLIMRYRDAIVAITAGQIVYLVAVVLWVTLFLSLYRALRGSSPAPALCGSGLSFMGLVVYAVGALPVLALAPISNLYHASGATSVQQATLVLMWQATQGIFNETDTVGFAVFSIGLIVLGVAMLRVPAFGKIFGGVSVVIGVAGVLGISLVAIDSPSFSIFGILAFIIYPLLFGWKLYSMSRKA